MHVHPADTRIDSDQHWTVTLRNGTPVAVRPIVPEDAVLERGFLERLSDEARRHRFLGQFRTPNSELVQRLTHVDPLREVAYVAVANGNGVDQIVGAARFGTDPGQDDAECAVVVQDDWQDLGLGESLMRLLIEEARRRGLRLLYSIDACDNADMAELARHLGFTRRRDAGDPAQVIHELAL